MYEDEWINILQEVCKDYCTSEKIATHLAKALVDKLESDGLIKVDYD